MLIQGQRLAIICFVRSFCRFINSFALSKESYGSMSGCLKDIITCIITLTLISKASSNLWSLVLCHLLSRFVT
jgi:hypothetical protein